MKCSRRLRGTSGGTTQNVISPIPSFRYQLTPPTGALDGEVVKLFFSDNNPPFRGSTGSGFVETYRCQLVSGRRSPLG